MVIVPSKPCSSSRGYSTKFFFLPFSFFPTTTVPLFSPVVWQKICPGGRIRALVRNEEHFFHGNSRSIIEASYVSPYACTFFFFFLLLFLVDQSWPFLDLFFLGYRIIRMDKFVTLNETRTRTPRVHVCEITKRKRFRANVNIHDAAKEFQLEVGSVNFNHNYSRPLFIGCSVWKEGVHAVVGYYICRYLLAFARHTAW